MAKAPEAKLDAVRYDLADPVDVWHPSTGTKLTITYQFENSQPGDMWHSYSGWTALSAAEKQAIKKALAEYAKYLNVKFVEVTGQADPDINFGKVSLGSGLGGYGGFNYTYSTTNGQVTSKELDGYAVFKNSLNLADASNMDLILHEIGHAMTLKHTGDYDAGGGSPPGPFLPASQDNNKYSVMSYNDNPDSGEASDHLMLYDIAALQARFGANKKFHKDNDTYTKPDSRLEVIWDAGGRDKITAAGTSGAVTIDLREGKFSSLGLKDNLAIAYGAKIEDAKGGAGNDKLVGNNASNKLDGGKGNDDLKANGGNDQLLGGAGHDTLKGSKGKDVLQGGTGSDTMVGGTGGDRFVYKDGWGPDLIQDFGKGADVVDLRSFNFSSKQKALNKFTDASTSQDDILVFNFQGNELTVKGKDLDGFGDASILI